MMNVNQAPSESLDKKSVLPDFDAPPINEVVCGVQFDGLKGWQTVHFGLFWQRIREEYPNFQDQNPLLLLDDPDSGKRPQMNQDVLPLRRVWLIDATKTYVMQVDPPRFLHNWRRVSDSDPYPHFDDAYSRFTRSLDSFQSFVAECSLGDTRPLVYELSYINHIVAEEGSSPRRLENFLSFYRWQGKGTFLAEPSAFHCTLEVPLAKGAGKLRISVKPGARRSDGKSLLVLDLTARGLGKLEMNEWFDLAHETIVRGFVDITTSQAQTLWRRKV